MGGMPQVHLEDKTMVYTAGLFCIFLLVLFLDMDV